MPENKTDQSTSSDWRINLILIFIIAFWVSLPFINIPTLLSKLNLYLMATN